MLPEDLVLLLLPSELVLLAVALQVLDQVASRVGELPEENLKVLGWDPEVFLKSTQELVVGPLIRWMIRRLLLALDRSVTVEVGLDPKSL